jgi:hypothetical protein
MNPRNTYKYVILLWYRKEIFAYGEPATHGFTFCESDLLLRPQALTVAPMPFIEGTPPFQEVPIATEDDERSPMRWQQA